VGDRVRYLRLEDEVEAFFSEGGPLAGVIPGYKPRPTQVAMARAVARTLDQGENLLVEAPTGTGKSYGYGVPAALHIRRLKSAGKDVRVVVATANISLQEQLLEKDLPQIQALVPGFSFALAKGMNHYLCLQSAYGGSEEETRKINRLINHDAKVKRQLPLVNNWIERTETGDVSELDFEVDPRLWRFFSRSSEDCPGKHCKRSGACHVRKARTQVREANLIVANYAVVCLDLLTHNAVLGEYDVLIGDEAHRFADMARSVWGARVTEGAIHRAVKILESQELSEAVSLGTQSDLFFDALDRFRRSEKYDGIRLRRKLRRSMPVQIVDDFLAAAHKGAVALQLKGTAINESADSKIDPDEKSDLRAEGTKLLKAARRLGEHRAAVASAADLRPQWCYALDERNGKTALNTYELHPSEVLRHMLFAENQGPMATCMTSATLATGGSFDYVRRELGIDRARELVVESPFDYRRQARLVVPATMKDFANPGYAASVTHHACEVLKIMQGKVLLLFTAKTRLRSAVDAWQELRTDLLDVRPVLVQGDGSKQKISRQFREAKSGAILFGSLSFFEGFDAPGMDAVVVDKVPFPSMHDAVHNTLADQIGFSDYTLPRGAITLKQGFGRLVRQINDFGAVVVLDRRIVTKPYGRYLVESLPDVPVSEDLDDLKNRPDYGKMGYDDLTVDALRIWK